MSIHVNVACVFGFSNPVSHFDGDAERELSPADTRLGNGRFYGDQHGDNDLKSDQPVTHYRQVTQKAERWSLDDGSTLEHVYDRVISAYGIGRSVSLCVSIHNGDIMRFSGTIRSGKLEAVAATQTGRRSGFFGFARSGGVDSKNVLLQDGDKVFFAEMPGA